MPKNVDEDWLERYPRLRAYLERVSRASDLGYRLVHVKAAEIIIPTETGSKSYRRPLATMRWDRDGEIVVRAERTASQVDADRFAPTPDEAAAIKAEIVASVAKGDFPSSIAVASLHSAPCRDANPDDLFVCRDTSGDNILFVHQRTETGDYLPWSFWSDHKWRMMRPDNGMPLWGLDQLRHTSFVFLHEGAKAARFCRWLTTGDAIERWHPGAAHEARAQLAEHPWGAYLDAAHLGWLGGAPPSANQVDWSPLARRRDLNITLVCDNDDPGNEAAEVIAKFHLPQKMSVIRFDNDFPESFDLADPFPPELFRKSRGGKRYYIGPSIWDVTISSTWATEKVPAEKGRPAFRLRRDFIREWCWSVTGPLFFKLDRPGRSYNEREFNDKVRPFSDADDTARLLKRSAAKQVEQEAYEPARKPGVINVDGTRVFNSYRPPDIRPVKGDPAPWLDFMVGLIPGSEDRHNTLRWCATLITQRHVRILYGLLLASEIQGVGKSTLAQILSRLLGPWNVNTPSQEQLEGPYNGYLARTLLNVIEEIYAAESKRLYNKLKTYMTEPTVRVNEKFRPEVMLSNYTVFLATSNSRRALWMGDKDRRWFVPGVTERLRPRAYWATLHEWLDADGLGIILHWAREFVARNGAIEPGEHAPYSEAKRMLIEESKSEGQRLVRDLGRLVVKKVQDAERKFMDEAEVALHAAALTACYDDMAVEAGPPAASPPIHAVLVVGDVRAWLAGHHDPKRDQTRLEAPATILRELVSAGLNAAPVGKRFDVDGRDSSAVATFPLTKETTWADIKECRLKFDDLVKLLPPTF